MGDGHRFGDPVRAAIAGAAEHGVGYKAQASILAYQSARLAALAFAGRGPDSSDVAVICQNATEAIHHLACQLKLGSGDVVVTTVAEHHANLLPWSRVATCQYVECGQDGTFEPGDVAAALDRRPCRGCWRSRAPVTSTGWLPPLAEIIAAAHDRGVPVLVDAAQLAPHRPLPAEADFLAWSGHKMYAPFGAGVLVGPGGCSRPGTRPCSAAARRPCLVWTSDMDGPPEREEPGSPNVIGAVALGAAIGALEGIGWPAIIGQDGVSPGRCGADWRRSRGAASRARDWPRLAGLHVHRGRRPHALVTARLAARTRSRWARQPARTPLPDQAARAQPCGSTRRQGSVRNSGRSSVPGAIRASAGINTSERDVARLLRAMERLVSGKRRSGTAVTRQPGISTRPGPGPSPSAPDPAPAARQAAAADGPGGDAAISTRPSHHDRWPGPPYQTAGLGRGAAATLVPAMISNPVRS